MICPVCGRNSAEILYDRVAEKDVIYCKSCGLCDEV